jgi:hypothetical protein
MIICDLWAKNMEHLEINKAMIEILLKLRDKERIIYFGDQLQIERIKSNISKKIKFEHIKIEKGNRYIFALNIIYNLIKIRIRMEKEESIFILNGLPILTLFSRLCIYRKNKIYFLLHTLERVRKNKEGITKYFGYYIKYFSNGNFYYIVLGEIIRQNLLKVIPDIESKVFSVDHPYSFYKMNINKKIEDKIKISTCGITSEEKGLNNIFKFIDKIEKNLKFEHIGKSLNKIPDNYDKYFPYKNELISQEMYQNLIYELDYILILYPINSYKLTASGVYFDCIKFNKPLLGLRNEYFEYMFKKYGEIGKLFSTVDEIIDYLKKDRKILEKEQSIFWKNMENIRETLNKNVEKDLKNIIYQGVE